MSIQLTPMRWFAILFVVAIGVALGLPPDPHAVRELHTNPFAYRVAVAALLIPYSLIWYMGFYALAKMQEYSGPLKDTPDGRAFRKVTFGLAALAFNLIVPTIIELILTNIGVHNPSFKTAGEIISNYINLFSGLITFLLIFNGAQLLGRTVKNRGHSFDIRWHAPWFLLLSVVFAYLTIHNQFTGEEYHLSVPLLLVTIILPYTYSWLLGMLAAYEFGSYSKHVRGMLYKRSAKYLSRGIATVVTSSILIQFLTVTIAPHFRHSLSAILALDYLLLIIMAAGLYQISLGTRRLKKIEEV
jgi:hypothetical protein